MSDDEYASSDVEETVEEGDVEEDDVEQDDPSEEEVEVEVEAEEVKPRRKTTSASNDPEMAGLSEAARAMLEQKRRHEEEQTIKLKEYEEMRKEQREKEEEELTKLKEKQILRRQEREEEEREMNERRKHQEEERRKEEEERRAETDAKKRSKMEERMKKQKMLASQFAQTSGPNFKIEKKGGGGSKEGKVTKGKQDEIDKARMDEEKQSAMARIIPQLRTAGMSEDSLRKAIKDMHARMVKLVADTYDMDQRQQTQDYDLKELKDRMKNNLRQKLVKAGLDPNAAESPYPPKVLMLNKYDRQTDRRNFGEKKEVFGKINQAVYPNVPPPPEPLKKKRFDEEGQEILDDEEGGAAPKAKAEEGGDEEEAAEESEAAAEPEAAEKKPKKGAVFHGSARPPSEWGSSNMNTEELENIRKSQTRRYEEVEKVEGAMPPMKPVPVVQPKEDAT